MSKTPKVFESSSKNDLKPTKFSDVSQQAQIAGLYQIEETIGQGHFAVVKLAKHIFSGEKVAIKVIDKSKLDKISREHLFQEVKCMKLVQHPNVVRLYEVIDTATKLYLVLELGDGGDMYDYIMKNSHINNNGGLTEAKSKNYFRQIVRAVKYCHDLHVVHRDLKPENVVFFEQTGQVKLTDFGFSNVYQPGTKLYTSCGSLAYSAPEILLGDSYDAPAVDIWSLGVILYMLVTGRAPFQEASDSETLTMILDCKYIIPSYVSPPCSDLITKMILRNADERLKLTDIINHEWLSLDDLTNENNSSSSTTDTETIKIIKAKKKPKFDMESLPLIKREHLSKSDNDEIIESMLNGGISETRQEIYQALDEDNYSYITATYYLLAENLLRKHYIRKKRKLKFNSKANRDHILKKKQQNDQESAAAAPIEYTSSGRRKIIVKTNFNNLHNLRNTLKRQDEGVVEEDEQETESSEQLIDSDSQQQQPLPPLSTLQSTVTPQLHLTNILEDEEDIVAQTAAIKNNIITNSAGLVQFNSLSRRSSRGGNSSDNAISSLTIPEEAEVDVIFTNLPNQILSKHNDENTTKLKTTHTKITTTLIKKKRHHQFIHKRVSSAHTDDTNSSDDNNSSDTDNIQSKTNLKESLVLIEDYDWSRTASTSSSSKSRRLQNHYQQKRPLSMSSSTEKPPPSQQPNPDPDPTHRHSHHFSNNPNMRAKSENHEHEHLNGKGGGLSVEHRVSNMSQMSISSQLSKNNSIRMHTRSETQSQHQHSATPTPRESIVFNRGDEKPLAKILLSLNQSLKMSSNKDRQELISNDELPASESADESRNNELLIKKKIEKFNNTITSVNNDSYSNAILNLSKNQDDIESESKANVKDYEQLVAFEKAKRQKLLLKPLETIKDKSTSSTDTNSTNINCNNNNNNQSLYNNNNKSSKISNSETFSKKCLKCCTIC